MRIKSLISLVAIACLLMVAISPLTARNTPFPEDTRDAAHPWQDDNQYVEPEEIARISIPMGPIVISVDIPADWLGVLSNNTKNQVNLTTKSTKSVKTSKPMSFNKKGDIQ